MRYKNSKRIKYSLLPALSIIILFIIAIVLLSEGRLEPQRSKTILSEIQIIPINSNEVLRDSIVNFGMKFLNTPYVYGASRKDGFDCSGFVHFVFQHFKIQVPRSSPQFKNFGKEIPIDSVRKGDILIFLSPTSNVIGHVGIVTNPMGNESDFIHASSGNEMKVIISSLKQAGYKRRFVKALNVL
jgi:hypothetical protein